MSKPASHLPFIWPDLFNAPLPGQALQSPLDPLATHTTRGLFGAISNADTRAARWLATWLSQNSARKLRLVISIHPTCRTTPADLEALLHLCDIYGDRAAFRLYPEGTLADRASNLLCYYSSDGQASLSLGPSHNLGFDDRSPSRGNLATGIGLDTLNECRKWFDYLWGRSAPLDSLAIQTMPRFVLAQGDPDADRLWKDYRAQCFAGDVSLVDDPITGDTVLCDIDDVPLPSPTEAIDIPKLDRLTSTLAHIFSLGLLVSIDKQSRIPPLDAPVKPEWFGLESFRQHGAVSVQTSMKVAPFDDATLKKIERLRKASGALLPYFSFGLSDGVRWIPRAAISHFEHALGEANLEAKRLLGEAVGSSVEAFLDSQVPRIRHDAQQMYETYRPGGNIPDHAVRSILIELKTRLDKAMQGRLLPTVSYSPIAFNPAQVTEWSSPWGLAFSLLKSIAEFPRQAMTSSHFRTATRRVDEGALVRAMNVAGDAIVADFDSRKTVPSAERQLQLIKDCEASSADTRIKCDALWSLIETGDEGALRTLLDTTADGD